MLAYALISVAESGQRKVFEIMKTLPEFVDGNLLFGEWDIIAKLEIRDSEHLGQFMIDKIRAMPNIRLTSTLIVAQ